MKVFFDSKTDTLSIVLEENVAVAESGEDASTVSKPIVITSASNTSGDKVLLEERPWPTKYPVRLTKRRSPSS